jgi:hypothetical protein
MMIIRKWLKPITRRSLGLPDKQNVVIRSIPKEKTYPTAMASRARSTSDRGRIIAIEDPEKNCVFLLIALFSIPLLELKDNLD